MSNFVSSIPATSMLLLNNKKDFAQVAQQPLAPAPVKKMYAEAVIKPSAPIPPADNTVVTPVKSTSPEDPAPATQSNRGLWLLLGVAAAAVTIFAMSGEDEAKPKKALNGPAKHRKTKKKAVRKAKKHQYVNI